MKKLKIPKIIMPKIENEELAIKDFSKFMETAFYSDLAPEYEFDVNGFKVETFVNYSYPQGEYFIYAYISDSKYYYSYNAIVKTEKYYFHTYKQYLLAVKKMNKDLVNGWKHWVKQLYEEV